VIAAVLANVLHTDLIHLITTLIQQPLRLINTSLPGTIFIIASATSCLRWVFISRW
jgi:PTS system cellobiose-specific IIC component